jgi:hypothetical protein
VDRASRLSSGQRRPHRGDGGAFGARSVLIWLNMLAKILS